MLPRSRLFPFLGLIAALAAAPTEAQARDTVYEGMTEAEVVAVLGPPALVRRVDEWSYLFYPNGCPIICGKDDVVFLRGCRVVAGILLRSDRYWAGPGANAALRWTEPSVCGPDGRPQPPVAVSDGEPDRARPATDPPSPPTDTTTPAVTPPVTREQPSAPAPFRQDTTPRDRRRLAAFRDSLEMPKARAVVQAIPAGSISTPTAFGLDQGEAFVGAGFQHRTRYTDLADGAFVAGIGLGSRQRYVGVELAVSLYSTLRGTFGDTGGGSFKVHRNLDARSSLALGVENVVTWGDTDTERSPFAAWTRVIPLRADSLRHFTSMIVTLGVGSGRFRFEDDVIEDRQAVNFFGSVGVRVSEPVSVVADWTGQDLNMAVSVTPLRRFPVNINAGLADLTGLAGDGTRFIFSVGYGFLLQSPF
ncbi:MAG TPA: hypothetical protein VFX98_13130 [Longimicrobiaceae bacterium]|nr:hypothetical protein [Longimicrobiaceae bacterium]